MVRKIKHGCKSKVASWDGASRINRTKHRLAISFLKMANLVVISSRKQPRNSDLRKGTVTLLPLKQILLPRICSGCITLVMLSNRSMNNDDGMRLS
jgi:hypothetical protein